MASQARGYGTPGFNGALTYRSLVMPPYRELKSRRMAF
jgi:hypothetical protein